MARRKSSTFTEVELEFMQIIWELGEVSTESMMETLEERGRPLADGSIRKILGILLEKSHLTRIRSGRSFIYRPAVGKVQAHKRMIRDLLVRAFNGSPVTMVAALLDSREIGPGDIESIKQLIEDHEKHE